MRIQIPVISLFVTLSQSSSLLSQVAFTGAFSAHPTSQSSSAPLCEHRLCGLSLHRDSLSLSKPKRILKTVSTTMIFLQKPSTQETTQNLETDTNDESQALMKVQNARTDTSVDTKDTIRKVGKKVGKAAVCGFSYFMNVVGVYFTFGLLLNLCGYAYTFSFSEGYKIDTIKNRRIERQFEQESRRYEKERYESLSPLSVAGSINSESSASVAALAGATKNVD
mmetsp:Transcript_17746/g.36512  ORF Transcript_17746/g.36512 Transcript_17746/m.36512 type:complete len:223 (-) Transcript_17746:41-709(-)